MKGTDLKKYVNGLNDEMLEMNIEVQGDSIQLSKIIEYSPMGTSLVGGARAPKINRPTT